MLLNHNLTQKITNSIIYKRELIASNLAVRREAEEEGKIPAPRLALLIDCLMIDM